LEESVEQELKVALGFCLRTGYGPPRPTAEIYPNDAP
jgi:hypothetical protein